MRLIVGLALSETVAFYDLFLIDRSLPETGMLVFAFSLPCAVQFISTYALKDSAGAPRP